MLAQTGATESAATSPSFGGLTEIPSQSQLVQMLMDLAQHQYGAVLAVLLFTSGLVYMLQGWKIFKILVVVNVAAFGALAGNYLGELAGGTNTWVYTSIAGALLLGGLAWPLMKYAVSLLGGLFGAIVGYSLWLYVAEAVRRPEIANYAWVGAIVGLITLGLLAFVILKFVITFVTSLQGAVMVVGGVLTMLLKFLADSLEVPLKTNSHLALVLIGVPTIIGFVFQTTWSKPGKKKEGGK